MRILRSAVLRSPNLVTEMDHQCDELVSSILLAWSLSFCLSLSSGPCESASRRCALISVWNRWLLSLSWESLHEDSSQHRFDPWEFSLPASQSYLVSLPAVVVTRVAFFLLSSGKRLRMVSSTSSSGTQLPVASESLEVAEGTALFFVTATRESKLFQATLYSFLPFRKCRVSPRKP